MIKKIMIFFLLSSIGLNAGTVESEIGINVGMNSTLNEDGSKFKNPTLGVTYQNNKYVISPRIDLEYTKVNNDYASSFVKVSINGVYEYENSIGVIPYALAGVGYEYVGGATDNVLESQAFIQGGIGARVDLDDGYKVRVEGRMLQVIGSSNDESNEAIVTAGFSIPLGYIKPMKQKIIAKPTPQPVMVEMASPFPVSVEPKIVYIDKNECSVKIDASDLDRDGIKDSLDQCPGTPCDFSVDNYGCPIKATLKVNFETSSARIQVHTMHKVDKFSDFLLTNKGSFVQIIGHTDSRGSSMKNAALSQRRANSVMQALINRGVSASRLSAIGRGENMPLSSNKTVEGMAMNRRIEAILTYTGGRR